MKIAFSHIKNFIFSGILCLGHISLGGHITEKDVNVDSKNVSISYKDGYDLFVETLHSDDHYYTLKNMKVTMPTIVATAMSGKLNRKSLLLELSDNIECDVKEWHLSLEDLTIDFQNYSQAIGKKVYIARANSANINSDHLIINLDSQIMTLEGNVKANIAIHNF
jgi:hypothetical protein